MRFQSHIMVTIQLFRRGRDQPNFWMVLKLYDNHLAVSLNKEAFTFSLVRYGNFESWVGECWYYEGS